MPRLLIRIYFKATRVTGQKEMPMLRECVRSLSHTHTGSHWVGFREALSSESSSYGSGSNEDSRKFSQSDLSNLTMIHSCN